MLKKKVKPGASGFRYQERDASAVQKRATQQGGRFDSIFKDGVDTWRPKEGENVIRIMPPTWDDHDHYGYDIWIHGYVGPDKSTYLCPQKMNNEPCPICRAARDAKAAGEEDDAKQLTARRQVAVWIIDRNDEKSTPSLFTMSWSMDRDIAALCHNKRTGKVLLLDHPDQGYDISFTRTGKGLNTRYIGMAVDRQDSAMMQDEDEQEKVLEYLQENPIPDMLNFYDADYLGKVVEGGTDERDEELDKPEEDEDADERPAKKKLKPGPLKDRDVTIRTKSRRVEPEEEVAEEGEEEVPDEEVEEPDEDDRPPAKKKFQSAPKSKGRREELEEEEVVEDEQEAPDEEEVVDEADDEPAPKKKAASKPERRAGFRSGRR